MNKRQGGHALAVVFLVFFLVWGLLFSVGYWGSSESEWDSEAVESVCTVLSQRSRRKTCEACTVLDLIPSTADCAKGRCCYYACWDVLLEVESALPARAFVTLERDELELDAALAAAAVAYPLDSQQRCWYRPANESDVRLERDHGYAIALGVLGFFFVALAALVLWRSGLCSCPFGACAREL